jgi:salicylate hydroxylase
VNPKHISCRLRRALLQGALLKEVDQSRIQLNKKLVTLEKLPSGKVEIKFEDGFTDQVDLIVAADGIRSVGTQPGQSLRVSY